MKNNSPKHIALKTLIKHKCYSLNDCDVVKRIIESNQFTIIEYKKHNNSQPVSELINKLRLQKEIEQNDSFLYINKSLKFLFINASVSDEDKCALLRHELGHICDPDLKNSDAHYSKIQKEEFANEFSGHTKNPGILFKLYVFLAKKWKLLVGLLAITACILGLAFFVNTLIFPSSKSAAGDLTTSAISDGTYYITSAGKKYHQKHCIVIKYKNNLTQIKSNDAINDGYAPCMICNPGE